jgi:arginyl-tRNA synthetase
MPITEELAGSVSRVLGDLGIVVAPGAVRIERPARPEHGDFATNAALVHAKALGRPPRQLAEALAAGLEAAPPRHLRVVEIAGPGFVNFRLHEAWLHEALTEILTAGPERYAAPDLGHGERVQVEFVSANPTGPIHVGNGWLASYGDALARLLERTGHHVTREYYVNDTGGQIRNLGRSILARRAGAEVPEGGYQGEYVTELADRYEGPDEVEAAGRYACEVILSRIRASLERIGIVFDSWYSQASIEESGRVEMTMAELSDKGLCYEADGALWLATTRLGDRRDRVLRKSDGDPTYLAGDLAYHRNKFLERGFDRVIDVFGADHHGQVASLIAGVEALGVPSGHLEVRIGQIVSLVGQKMSKRSGHFVALDTLVGEIGVDATRILSLLSSIDQATTIDLDVLTATSAENPVYYLQYAYARIASIERVAAERGIVRPPLDATTWSVLVHPRELEMVRTLAELPDVVAEATVERAPYKVTNFVRRLAGDFHAFYHDCSVLGDEVPSELTAARLWLIEAARVGLGIGLELLGLSAPSSM